MSKKVGIVELVTALGNDGVRIQPLDGCLTDMKSNKHGSKYTFGSEIPFDLNGPTECGIVVWMPRDKVKEILGR